MEENTNLNQESEEKKMNPMVLVAVVGVVSVLGLGFLISRKTSGTSGTTSVQDELAQTVDSVGTGEVEGVATETGQEAVAAETEVTAISVEAGSFYYKPDVIRVKVGEKVKIELKAVDMMHDFNVDELGIKAPIIKSGETGSVEFTASTPGSFEYYCSVGQHRKNGQVGTLIVE